MTTTVPLSLWVPLATVICAVEAWNGDKRELCIANPEHDGQHIFAQVHVEGERP